MQVAVFMDEKAAFVMQGKPNGSYFITTKPLYHIAVTDYKEGTVISANFMSHPAEVVFRGGATKVTGTLDHTLLFHFDY